MIIKGGLISEGILTLVPLPAKCAKLISRAEDFNKLFTEKGRKFKVSAQGCDLALFVGNGSKDKIPTFSNISCQIPAWLTLTAMQFPNQVCENFELVFSK